MRIRCLEHRQLEASSDCGQATSHRSPHRVETPRSGHLGLRHQQPRVTSGTLIVATSPSLLILPQTLYWRACALQMLGPGAMAAIRSRGAALVNKLGVQHVSLSSPVCLARPGCWSMSRSSRSHSGQRPRDQCFGLQRCWEVQEPTRHEQCQYGSVVYHQKRLQTA